MFEKETVLQMKKSFFVFLVEVDMKSSSKAGSVRGDSKATKLKNASDQKILNPQQVTLLSAGWRIGWGCRGEIKGAGTELIPAFWSKDCQRRAI